MNSLRLIAAAALSLAAATSQANSYLNWSSSDYGMFESARGGEQDMRVLDSYGDGWQKFSSFLGAGERWVWTQAGSEVVYLYNSERRANEKLVNFADAVGKRYSVKVDVCTNSALLAEKNLNLSTVAGAFKNVVRMEFSGNCADAGITQAWFAPAVGLVQWEEQSIMGPVLFTLARGVIGGKHYPVPALQVVADLPRSHLIMNGNRNVTAGLTVINNSNSDLSFRFDGGQEFEISLLTLDGEVLNTWGANKRFTQGEHAVVIKANSSHYFGGEIAIQGVDGEALDIGTYLLRIEMKGSHAPEASAFSRDVLKLEAPLFLDRRMQAF